MFFRIFTSWKSSTRLRAHYVLEPPFENEGGFERLSRYYEEMNGNKLLDENSTFASWGKMHSGLRELMGGLTVKLGRIFCEPEEEGEGS